MYDLVIIGGGPAGLTAALEANKNNLKTLLIERDHRLGGILHQCIHNGFGIKEFEEELTGPEYAHRLIEELKNTDVEVWTGTLMRSVRTGYIECVNTDGIHEIKAKAILMCLGCRERTAGEIAMLGERPSGVFMAGAVQKMINLEGILPGKRAIIYGSGDIGLIMARRLVLSGVQVDAVIEIAKSSPGLPRNIQQCLVDYNIPLLLHHGITNILGQGELAGVEVKNLTTGEIVNYPCDTLLLSVGLKPLTEHLSELNLDINLRSKGPVVDSNYMSSVDGIFFCGNNLHVHDIADEVSEEARLAIKGITSWIKNTPSTETPLLEGDGISLVIPNSLGLSTSSSVYFRVTSFSRGKTVLVKDEKNRVIFKRRYPVLRPSQGERVELPQFLDPVNSLIMEVID